MSLRGAGAAAVAGAVAAAAWLVHASRGRDASFAVLVGLAFGAILQRSRLCFASAFRDLYLQKDRRTALGVLAALAAGSVGYLVVFGAQMPDPSGGYVPPTAFISRVGWHVLLGGASFGFGMVIGGGCISGHLFRLGEGKSTAVAGLLGDVAGFVVGYLAWNPLWTATIAMSPAVWLPKTFGYAGAAILQIGALAVGAGLLLRFLAPPPPAAHEPATLAGVARRVFVAGWPGWAGGLALGALATLAYFRGTPLGVTAELSRLGRLAGDAIGAVPARLEGMDLMTGCRPPMDATGLSANGLLIVSLVAGSLAMALAAGEFRPRVFSPRRYALAFVGGIFLGFGALISTGCTVGAMLSGTMAFSLHGWVFLVALAGGAWGGSLVWRRMEGRSHAAPAPPRAPGTVPATAGPTRVLDLRGEPCGVPAERVVALIRESPSREPIVVLADRATLEDLPLVAAREGWECRIEPAEDGGWRALLAKAAL
ncbi:MAG: YeeE/YedE family protein [Planctomycetales bacterium]|nr:YeeE/YedE family protein [Planctomycetales bacterium]